MFDIGFWEIGLIFIVLLLVVGPERLPRVVRTLGLWIGKARRMVAEVKAEVDRELRVEELKQSLSQQVPTDEFKRLASQVRSINREVKDSIDQGSQPPLPGQTPQRSDSHRRDKAPAPSSADSGSEPTAPAETKPKPSAE